MDNPLPTHRGGCHCGAVAYEFEAPTVVTVHLCNCSICAPLAYLHLIVPAARFRVVRGVEALVEYRWGTGVARHRFCGVCGIKSFYVPRSNPNDFSVNLRCVEPGSFDGFRGVTIEPFDGQDWEGSIARLGDAPLRS